MSTRTNIILQNDSCKIILYRHCDGYLSETGKDIFRLVDKVIKEQKGNALPSLVNAFLGRLYANGEHIYSITDSIHGDIEHLYKVIIFPTKECVFKEDDCVIGHSKIDWERIEFSKKFLKNFSLAGWLYYINEAIENENKAG